ncbi:outer membrane protein assembly factor BamC [Glaciecola sp. 1036]|uniref:outer membrane protein assembly factor BamC n=1 Tax=Alteromonadaceae TaxID=72275 RepID=UPI003D04CFBC
MQNHKVLVVLLTMSALSACSTSQSRKQASGEFDYLEKSLQSTLEVPQELDAPESSTQYAIPTLESSASGKPLIGPEVSVQSPRLVIPLVAGSHVEEGSRDAKVLFDQINDNESLDKTIWDTVLAYLELNQIGVEEFDKENNTLITDWVVDKKEIESSWYSISDEYIEHAKRFKLSLEMAPHGRTAALKSELVEYLDEKGNSILVNRDPLDTRNDEVNFLNYIIAEYDFGIRLERNQRINLIREGFASEFKVSEDGEPIYVIDAEYANAWPRLQLVLRKMNFDVVDLDQSSGIMFVKYNGPDESWFSSFFGSDELDLEEDDYRLSVESSDNKTIVTFKDSDNNAFSEELAQSVYAVFSEYMAANDLDI